MSTINTISNAPPAEIAMDYARLREEGLRYIEQFGSAFWTDFNIHDPGITLLELLCYAITDLGYRTSMPMEDLLSSEADNAANFKKQFFTCKEILPTHPVSELDLRKLLIDIDGVKNAWLFKSSTTLWFDKQEQHIIGIAPNHKHYTSFQVNGLYDIKIELDEVVTAINCETETNPTPEELEARKAAQNAIIEKVRSKFHTSRNLCEDLVSVTVVEEQKIRFCMDVEVEPTTDAKEVHAVILYEIGKYLAPDINQYNLHEMTEARKSDGSFYSMDEIFSGPVLDHGFMKDHEVLNASLRTHIYASDIISLLMDIPGVVSVKNFLMNYCDDQDGGRHQWCLKISDAKKPVLCACKSAINFYKDVVPVNAPRQEAINKWMERLSEERLAKKKKRYGNYNFYGGQWRNTSAYTSISQNLPLVYGTGDDGIPASAGVINQIKALQLKGYLLFFDQALTNYLAHLSNLKNLLQVKDSPLSTPSYLTYAAQKVSGLKDISLLIDDFDNIDQPGKLLEKLLKEFDNTVDRKNRILDHLLSRFAENFSDYVLQLYAVEGQQTAKNVIASKALLLSEYDVISRDRSAAFDYFNQKDDNGDAIAVWDTHNVSGMEHRLSRLLGIKNYKRRNLSANVSNGTDEGMFVVEHILLRPNLKFLSEKNQLSNPLNFIPVCQGDDCDGCDDDPYSFRITVILPAESNRFKNFDFRTYIEKTIRLETPAHIYPRICWWSRQDLKIFEPIYKKWLEAKQAGTENTDEGLQTLQELIKVINEKKSIYPPGRISDCEDPVDNPVILDRTNLGNLKT